MSEATQARAGEPLGNRNQLQIRGQTAIAGKSQSSSAPTLAPFRVAQRVKFDPAAASDCEGNRELVEAQLEIAGRQFLVTRVSGDPDALSVTELGGQLALSTRAALTWDSVVGC